MQWNNLFANACHWPTSYVLKSDFELQLDCNIRNFMKLNFLNHLKYCQITTVRTDYFHFWILFNKLQDKSSFWSWKCVNKTCGCSKIIIYVVYLSWISQGASSNVRGPGKIHRGISSLLSSNHAKFYFTFHSLGFDKLSIICALVTTVSTGFLRFFSQCLYPLFNPVWTKQRQIFKLPWIWILKCELQSWTFIE